MSNLLTLVVVVWPLLAVLATVLCALVIGGAIASVISAIRAVRQIALSDPARETGDDLYPLYGDWV